MDEAVPTIEVKVLPYLCGWQGCDRAFANVTEIRSHQIADHQATFLEETQSNNPQQNAESTVTVSPTIPRAPIDQAIEQLDQKIKHPGGAPCKFCANKDHYLKLCKDYILTGKGDKPKILFINELAMILDIHRDTLWEWRNKKKEDGSLEHAEFSDYVKSVEEIQELRLQQRVLGRYNPTGAIFLLKTKHGYLETEKQILAGDKDEPLEIVITEDPTRTKYEGE